MLPLIYSVLESALNRILEWDPDMRLKLSKLQGKTVKISLTDWRIDFYFLLQLQEIKLQADYSGEVDATIRGTLSGLIKAGCSGASGPALFDQGVEVSGDLELGEKIRDILRQVDLDWEEELSRFVGDAAAYEIGKGAKKAVKLGKQTLHSLGMHLKEFFQYEGQYLPHGEQVEAFYRDIANLRDDVERAAARLDRLEQELI